MLLMNQALVDFELQAVAATLPRVKDKLYPIKQDAAEMVGLCCSSWPACGAARKALQWQGFYPSRDVGRVTAGACLPILHSVHTTSERQHRKSCSRPSSLAENTMRLLTRREDDTFEFAQIPHNDVPRYAILSHTWGTDDQELTFRDIAEGAGKDKDGYKKLEFCAGQAVKDGLKHCWIDTCCIDKTNSTELGTAINSMFRWYRQAEKCYVYLTDVSLDTASSETNEDDLRRASWKIAFRRSRWMTRGWTLQELVAPRSVDFFSKNGSKLGDKRTLEDLLHETTGISVEVLRGRPLADLSINERFSWLETRSTKVPEDRAYCMFGIFDVQLPLIYSEGEEKAMARLRSEIGECLPLKFVI